MALIPGVSNSNTILMKIKLLNNSNTSIIKDLSDITMMNNNMPFKIVFSLFLVLFTNTTTITAQEKQPSKKSESIINEFEINEVNEGSYNNKNIDKSEKGIEGLDRTITVNYNRNSSSTADGNDIGTPTNSTFQLGGDIQGSIKNSVNQITGKVAISVPLASIASGSVGYSLNLAYNGQLAFDIAKQQNKYNPTSTVGLGWVSSVSKIVVDNKQTATMDDDVFYLLDGGTTSKLICTNKEEYVWTFKTEKYTPWVIKYHKGFSEYDDVVNPPQFVSRESDYWSMVKGDGKTCYYGYSTRSQYGVNAPSAISNSKENVVAWGNWIGDSKKPNGRKKTIVWNISRIEDQWNNVVDFTYELQEVIQSSWVKQTEASYLKKISSSNGASIQLNYGFKEGDEYYEPHSRTPEPDAYQERYEKKYLQNVKVYKNSGQINSTYDLGYSLYGTGLNRKRYLTSITQISHEDGGNHNLPPQQFEYNLSGSFKGSLKKIIYPLGGSVKYNYQSKYLFYNGANKYEVPASPVPGYVFYASLVKDDYLLYVRRTAYPVSGNKYRFKIYRYLWTGEQWKLSSEFTIPHLMEDISSNRMAGFASVFEDDFYAFIFDAGHHANLFLFHKNKDGLTWDETVYNGMFIGEGPPSLMSGNDFIALGRHHTGRLDTFIWNGTTWDSGLPINQGGGQYYYAATNNFILSLNEDGGGDMMTGLWHEDNYYIHYLDAEKKWKTKSWSAKADPHIAGIEKPSRFYPSNSMSGFVADDNPELFLRWDDNYDLKYIDNVLGAYNDNNPLQPVGNGLFTLHNFFYGIPYKSARFNGANWKIGTIPNSSTYYAKLNFGENLMTFQNNNNFPGVGFHLYDPDSDGFSYGTLNNSNSGIISNSKANGIAKEFIVAGNKIYKRSNGPTINMFDQIGSLQYSNNFTHTDGLNHAYVKESQYSGNSINFKKGSLFHINKENGLLTNTNLGLKYNLGGLSGQNSKFGGNTPFMSPKAIWLRSSSNNGSFSTYIHRIINDKINQSIYNTVVNSIEIDDDNELVRKVAYTYNNPKSTPDNSSVYYGEVIVENKGFGTNSIGKTKTKFNVGSDDLQMIGLTLEEQILDANNVLKAKTLNFWEKSFKNISNGSSIIDKSYHITLKTQSEELFYDNYSIINETNNSYNSKGQLSSVVKTNSKGQTEREDIRYAYEQYNFVRDKNMLGHIYEKTTKLNNQIVNIERINWENLAGKVYAKENWSGSNSSNIRLNSQITNVDARGNILESNNGKNIYTSVLNGYGGLYEVANIVNAKHQDVVDELDVNYNQLQNLNTIDLKAELIKLYDRLPNTMIRLSFYDENGRVINRVNERKEESYIYYDPFGRVDYISDGYGKVIQKKEYNFGD